MTTERDDQPAGSASRRLPDLERRIADSLRNRADDVSPTPELWTRVESTVNANTRRTWILAAAGVTAAVAAVVIVPQLFESDSGPIVGEGPSETPTVVATDSERPTDGPVEPGPSETEDEGISADSILVTDGEDLFRMGGDGTRGDTLFDGDPADGRSIVSFSIRPGSTEAVLDAIVLFRDDDGSRFFHLRLFDGQASLTELPDQYQPGGPPLAEPPRPAFSPDGRHVAWVEMPDDEQAEGPTLRTIGWTDEGPGTGRPADDNASFTLTELPLQAYRVEDWFWNREQLETPGHLVLRAAGPIETLFVPIARQADGALILPIGGTTLLDGAVVDLAHTSCCGGLPIQHELQVGSDGTQDAEGLVWRIVSRYEDGAGETVVNLGATADPGLGWLDAIGERALAGHGSAMVLMEGNGEITVLNAPGGTGMWFGALIPPA
ncbi:MAG: hypothetical protein R3249_04230 [Nitriliruptorales bacterium]|nr:hypothetical protein [Nitriliruptorales bacterium]